jgi:hypothetical protein
MGLLMVFAVSWRPGSAPVVEDELYWIGSAYYYDLGVHKGEWDHPDWRLLPARENPPMAKFIIGAALAATGERVSSPDQLAAFYLLFAGIPGAWGDAEDRVKREAVAGRIGEEALRALRTTGRVELPIAWLTAARGGMLVCLATASLALFLLGRGLLGPWPALIAAWALPLHPIAAEAMHHALADAPAMMLSAAAAVALAGALRLAGRERALSSRGAMLGALAGVLAGLACAAKMNALMLPLLGAAGYGVLLARARGKPFAGAGKLGYPAIFALAGVAAFLAVNPALYGDWWAGVWATVGEHRRTAEIQAGFLAGRLSSPGERLDAVGSLIGFNRWAWLPLLAAALALLCRGPDRYRFIAGWWLLAWGTVTVWIPFSRLRYAAPLLLPSLLLVLGTLCWVWERRRTGRRALRAGQSGSG